MFKLQGEKNKLKHSLSSEVIPYGGFCSELGGGVRGVTYLGPTLNSLSPRRASGSLGRCSPGKERVSILKGGEGPELGLNCPKWQFPRVALESFKRKGIQVMLLVGFQSWPGLLAYLPDNRYQAWPECYFKNINTHVTPILPIAKPRPSLWPARPPSSGTCPHLSLALATPLQPHLIRVCFIPSSEPVSAAGVPPS